jgi:hypothetical protein
MCILLAYCVSSACDAITVNLGLGLGSGEGSVLGRPEQAVIIAPIIAIMLKAITAKCLSNSIKTPNFGFEGEATTAWLLSSF